VLDGETWRWFTARLFGLSADSRTWTALRNRPKALPAKPTTTSADINKALRR
jgi:hypothetical protein